MPIYKKYWFVVDGINPEPWAIGNITIAYGKNGGKFPKVGQNVQLRTYQDAIAESVRQEWPRDMIPGKVSLEFFFWRKQDEYKSARGSTDRKNEADATNMQKATEDALQSVLYENDRDVSSIYSEIMEQGPDVEPKIVISFTVYVPTTIDDFPGEVKAKLLAGGPTPSDNSWNGPGY